MGVQLIRCKGLRDPFAWPIVQAGQSKKLIELMCNPFARDEVTAAVYVKDDFLT